MATSLFSSVICGDSTAAMDSFIRSASDGPPRRELRASALMGRPEGRSALGSVVEVGSAEAVSEFSMLHFKSWFRPGSMMERRGARIGQMKMSFLAREVKLYS